MNMLLPGLVTLACGLVATNTYAATYPGQACQGQSATLAYSNTGARNATAAAMSISCPFVRTKDGGTAAAGAVAYFTNDGKTKSCYLDNFSIDSGALLKWSSTSGVTRLVLPTINPTAIWQPFALNCSLPAGSKINGYYFAE